MPGEVYKLDDIRKYMSDEWNAKVDTVLELEKTEWDKPEPNLELATGYRIQYLNLTETMFESGVNIKQNNKNCVIILLPISMAMKYPLLRNIYPVYIIESSVAVTE